MTCSTSSTKTHDEVGHRRAADRAIGYSALGLGVAGLAELGLALFTGSVGLLGDALHNLSDVSTSVLVFVGFRFSKRSPSNGFPYGYDRAEDLAGLGIAVVIWASALFAGVESVHKLTNHGSTHHLGVGMVGALIGIVANRVVAAYKLRVGKQIQSATLIADARHSWLDAISSAGALAGLVAVALGAWWGDPVAGIAVTLFIAHVGWEVTSDLSRRLMDGVDPEIIEQSCAAALAVEGVAAVTSRARWSGRRLTIEAVVTVASETPLGEATHICRHVELAILEKVPSARTVQASPIGDHPYECHN